MLWQKSNIKYTPIFVLKTKITARLIFPSFSLMLNKCLKFLTAPQKHPLKQKVLTFLCREVKFELIFTSNVSSKSIPIFPCCKFCTTLSRENSAITSMSPNASASSRPAIKRDILIHLFGFQNFNFYLKVRICICNA